MYCTAPYCPYRMVLVQQQLLVNALFHSSVIIFLKCTYSIRSPLIFVHFNHILCLRVFRMRSNGHVGFMSFPMMIFCCRNKSKDLYSEVAHSRFRSTVHLFKDSAISFSISLCHTVGRQRHPLYNWKSYYLPVSFQLLCDSI